jgi:hypothetical protein
MKKLLVIAFLFVLTTINAQETFVKTYSSCISVENNIPKEEQKVYLTVVFNQNESKIIKFIFSNGNTISFSQASSVRTGTTKSGESYQAIDVVDLSFGENAAIQLLDNGILRLHYSPSNYTEYYE